MREREREREGETDRQKKYLVSGMPLNRPNVRSLNRRYLKRNRCDRGVYNVYLYDDRLLNLSVRASALRRIGIVELDN